MPSYGHFQAVTAAKRRVNGAPRDEHGHTGPTVLVIFGVAGDLTWRKLIPALYNLYLDKWLPEQFAVIGVDQKEMSSDELRQRLLPVQMGFSYCETFKADPRVG